MSRAAARDDKLEYLLDAGWGVAPDRVHDQLCRRGLLVGTVDPREILERSLPRLAVEALRVARLARGEIRLDVDLEEAVALDARARPPPVVAIGRDERGDAYHARLGEQRRDLADAADILLPVLGTESEVDVEAAPNAVAIENKRCVTRIEQPPLEQHRKRRLAGARQAGQPYHRARVPEALRPLGAGNVVLYRR